MLDEKMSELIFDHFNNLNPKKHGYENFNIPMVFLLEKRIETSSLAEKFFSNFRARSEAKF